MLISPRYDALKKLFPSTPLDPSYLATQQQNESSSLLPLHRRQTKNKWATADEFRAALDKERQKVEAFYKSKSAELQNSYEILEQEIRGLEEADLGADATIKEEDEDEDDSDHEHDEGEGDALMQPSGSSGVDKYATPTRPVNTRRESLMKRLTTGYKRRSRPGQHEADILESHLPNKLGKTRSSSSDRHIPGSATLMNDNGDMSPNVSLTIKRSRTRRSSDFDSSEDGMVGTRRERRSSVSSMSSHEQDLLFTGRSRYHSLALKEMDAATVPSFVKTERGNDEEVGGEQRPIWIWTATNDYGTVLRIGFKKRISAVWLEAYALKQYVELNLTAFEKILKKYDKNTNSKLKKQYVSNVVLASTPWLSADKETLDLLLARILFLYRRVAVSGDEDLAKEQLRSQLREKVVVDRETVWSQMVSGHRGEQNGIFRSISPELESNAYEDKGIVHTPLGRIRWPAWLSGKGIIFVFALALMLGIVQWQPFKRVEESNCLAMLLFCTILWATEAIPLFVTSLAVPFLVVILRVIRTDDSTDVRMTASNATKYIFSQMFSPTIMLLIGGFTIAAVLSKTRLDVMTATRILNAAGTKPSVVLLVLMCVATFASMWISNVAAPTLCYALVKPILHELHPKSTFSKALVIAIALASNIGGQASPISSPQNLIALGSMDPPLSWGAWFAISIPVSGISVIAIWAFLHVNYRWESDLSIPKMRKNTDSLSKTHYYVLIVSALTIALWCVEKNIEGILGDMGVIALIPLLAFFGTGILSKEDFHSFHWSIVFLAMGGIALGKATLSSGLLDDLDNVLERMVSGLGLYSILVVFACLALVIATFISHTIAAVLLVPIAQRIGESLPEQHPRLLIMATALICSAGMGLPVSGFPNMTAINQENKLGQRYIGAPDFLKNGVPASILATFVIVTIGYAIMRPLGL